MMLMTPLTDIQHWIIVLNVANKMNLKLVLVKSLQFHLH